MSGGHRDEKARSTNAAISVLCLGGVTVALSQTIVIPVQPRLPALLDTSASNAAWVITMTLLAGAVAMPIMGRLADMVGKRLVLATSAFVMALGSAVCALSDSLAPILVGRALQGMALGFISVGISMIREFTPPARAPAAVATMSATLGVGGAVALPLSAWIIEVSDWHILFWVSTAMALAVGVLVLTLVPQAGGGSRGHLDLGGALVLAVGLVLLLVGVSKDNDWGWGSPAQLGCTGGGALVLVMWLLLELRTPEPLIDLRTSGSRPVLLTNLASLAIGFGLMTNGLVIPRLMQLPTATGYGLGQTLLATAMWMAPGGLVMLFCAPFAGRFMASRGPRAALIVGAVLLATGFVASAALMGSPVTLVIASCISSAGLAVGYAAMPYLILDSVPVAQAAAAVGLNGLMRSMGTTISAAVMGVILTSETSVFSGAELPTRHAFEACFVLGAAAAGLGALLVLGVKASEPTRRQRSAVASGVAAAAVTTPAAT